MNAPAPEVTTAVERAAAAIADQTPFSGPSDEAVARVALTAALDVPQMAAAFVDHLPTDTLEDDSETLVCACGHVLVTGDPDDDRDPQAEHATHHAALIRAAILGGAA